MTDVQITNNCHQTLNQPFTHIHAVLIKHKLNSTVTFATAHGGVLGALRPAEPIVQNSWVHHMMHVVNDPIFTEKIVLGSTGGFTQQAMYLV